jgi:hypothetical protein
MASRWAMSYLRGPVTLAEMGPLVERQAVELADHERVEQAPKIATGRHAPPLATEIPMVFAAGSSGRAVPTVVVRNRIGVQRATLDLHRELEEAWQFPIDHEGRIKWNQGTLLPEMPEVVEVVPTGLRFPSAAPGTLSSELESAAREFVGWRARRPLLVLINERLKMVAEEGEGMEEFLSRCFEAADRADDATEKRVRKRFEGRIKTLKKRLDRERDELERDRAQLSSRKAEEKMGMVEGLLSVLLGSESISSASRKAASRARSAAGKRRMRQSAEAAVTESENEIQRLEAEIDELATELHDEIDRIAAESEEKAEQIVEKPVKAKKADVHILELRLVWG